MVSDARIDRNATATYLSDQFSDTIEAVYQHAIRVNPSLRNEVAYAGYLASHGRLLDGLEEFKRILQNAAAANQPALLKEIGERISRLESRLEDDPALWQPIHPD